MLSARDDAGPPLARRASGFSQIAALTAVGVLLLGACASSQRSDAQAPANPAGVDAGSQHEQAPETTADISSADDPSATPTANESDESDESDEGRPSSGSSADPIDSEPIDPLLDTDGDGIPDIDDKCPTEPEVYNGIQDDDGCPC